MLPANENTRKQLLKFADAPEYTGQAIMITAPWGGGKTFFVKQLIADLKKKNDDKYYVYISLFGADTADRFDKIVLRALYPALSWFPPIRVLLNALRGVGDDIESALGEIANKHQQGLYVFDDIERSAIETPILMGLLSRYIDDPRCKVILVANAEKVAGGERFADVKERLVGRTYLLEPPAEAALDDFLGQLGSSKAVTALRENKAAILQTFNEWKSQNLRILKQALVETHSVLEAIEPRWVADQPVIRELIQTHFAICCEFIGSNVKDEDLSRRQGEFAFNLAPEGSEHEDVWDILNRKYSSVDLRSDIFSDEILRKHLLVGQLDGSALSLWLKEHRGFENAFHDEKPWVTVWNAARRSPNDVQSAWKEIEGGLERLEFRQTGEILHVFSLHHLAAEIGLIALTKSEILDLGTNYVERLQASGALHPVHPRYYDQEEDESFEQHRYQRLDVAEFQEFRSRLRTAQFAEFRKTLPAEGQKILIAMREGGPHFREVIRARLDRGDLSSVPVFATIDPKEFVNTLIASAPQDQLEIVKAYAGRAQSLLKREALQEEGPWIAEVVRCLVDRLEGMHVVESWRTKRYLLPQLESALKVLVPQAGESPSEEE